MNKLNYAIAIVLTLTMMSLTKLTTTKYNVVNSTSTFKWTGKKVTGSHWGYVKFSDGTLSFENNVLKSGTFNIDMTTMDCQDTKGEYGDKLIGHLKSDDFFSTEKFPKATLVIKSATTKIKGQYTIVADLTIKGITNEITFPAKISQTAKTLTASANFNINRTKYDIKYGSGSFFDNLGDKAIEDNFNVEINLNAVASK